MPTPTAGEAGAYDLILNPPDRDISGQMTHARQYSGWYSHPNNADAFALSEVGTHRLWRLASNQPLAYEHWIQIALDSPRSVSGVARQTGAICEGEGPGANP